MKRSSIDKYDVSVIIPCYNSENTIRYALDSLTRQTYKNFEVIIVNDGSVDHIEQKIEEYKKQLAITYIYKDNEGVSVARNVGLDKASGKYIVFLDSDDVYSPDYIEILYGEIEKNQCDIVTSQYILSDIYCEMSKVEKYNAFQTSRCCLFEIYNYKRENKINFINCIYKKDIIEAHEIRFPKGIKYGEDSTFFLQYLSYCEKCVVTDAILYTYMVHNSSAMSKVTYERTHAISAFQKGISYWENDELLYDSASRYAVDRAIWACVKDFAITNIQYFRRLCEEYPVDSAMDNMAKNCNEKPVKISAKIYSISKWAFVGIMKLYALIHRG